MTSPFRLTLLSLTLALFLGTSCSSTKVNENDPASLFADAEADIKSDRYQLAIDKLRMIRNKFPYSSVAVLCQLRIADVYYLQDSYLEAAMSYQTFRDLYPRHEQEPYASYRIAESYFKDIPDVRARDIGSAVKAQEAYEQFIALHPASPLLADAKKGLIESKSIQASKELQIAKFYYRAEKWNGVVARLNKLLSKFGDTPEATEAKELLEKTQSLSAKGTK